MQDEAYKQRLTNEKCEIFGKMLALSAEKYHFDSLSYIERLMTDKRFEDILMVDERTEWCDEYFLSSVINDMYPFETGNVLDPYMLWFIGYTYKYWMRTRNLTPKTVYDILPIRTFIERFGFYHTQGWEYIIADAQEN